MPGLYFHIPFCHKACTYCDFHFSTSLRTKGAVLAAMRKELQERIGELNGRPLTTIYFGGGTPSLLSPEELSLLMGDVRILAHVEPHAEITLEANPDDVSAEALAAWRSIGITRISIGIQSFREERLRWMNRSHTAEQSQRAIALVAKAGLASWTIDLIYGLPGMAIAEWDEQISIALDHGMPHLSAYCLTVEQRTALHKQVQTHQVALPDDGQQAAQFQHLMDRMARAGLVQYEISNFGREGHFAKHNTSYWQGVPYLGIGPSAHSYNGMQRRWNMANNVRYADRVQQGTVYWEEETLTENQHINERVLTGLRTIWGVDLAALGKGFREANEAVIQRYLALDELALHNGHLILTQKGKNFADRIASDLFLPAP